MVVILRITSIYVIYENFWEITVDFLIMYIILIDIVIYAGFK